MFQPILFAWRFMADGWSSPRRARLLYVIFAAGFVALAVAGAVKGDPLVVLLGVVFGLLTAAIAVIAPRLSPRFARTPPPEEAEQ
jgi:peptidoglycan/LPS O-acetylase OafA/YrhL